MKKIIALIMAMLLALSASALAATYTSDDINFDYDDSALEITQEEHKDDDDTVILGFKNKAWGDGYIRIRFQEIPDEGEAYPTWEEIAESLGTTTDKMENLPTWGNYTDVITTSIETGNITETVFIVPVFDDDNHADMLTITIGTAKLEDEDAAIARDDAISQVVDTLKVND